ncbi:MAG: MFS transporter [Asgard group archaeon]|nr:MFS transporter [Asgard group archaeon]
MNNVMSSNDEIVPEESELILTQKGEIEVETRTSKLNVFKWSMYDLANTIYSMIIVSLMIKAYSYIIGQKEHLLDFQTTVQIVAAVFIVMQIIVAIGMPIMGSLGDNVGKRKPFVLVLTGIILIFASAMSGVKHLAFLLTFFVIANIAYQWSLAFYDSMLPFVAAPKDAGKVGGFGVAFGYFGTIISLPVMLLLESVWGSPVSQIPDGGTLADIQYGYFGQWFTPVIAMGMFLIFAIPFIFVRERQKKGQRPPIKQLIGDSFRQVGSTFKDIRKHKEMFKFIIGYFLVVDVANTIVAYMYVLITDGLLMDSSFGIYFIIISTVSAVIFTFFIGMFADKFGAKKTFYLVGALWAAAIIIGVISILVWASETNPITLGFNFPFIMVLLMGILSGPALGGTWVAQRAMVTELAPKEKYGEYFGFSKLSGKVSSIVGEGIWALVFFLYAILAYKTFAVEIAVMGLVMAVGILIISFVKPAKHLLQEKNSVNTESESPESNE